MTFSAIPEDLPAADSLVFVYGTLQRGGVYHPLMEEGGGVFVCNGKTATKYPLLIAQYPCLLDLPGKGCQVEGEVYRLPNPAAWIKLDRLEGHPDEYRRRLEPIITGSGKLNAWTYFYIREDVPFGSLPAVAKFTTQ